jgi:hypothetical protein
VVPQNHLLGNSQFPSTCLMSENQKDFSLQI